MRRGAGEQMQKRDGTVDQATRWCRCRDICGASVGHSILYVGPASVAKPQPIMEPVFCCFYLTCIDWAVLGWGAWNQRQLEAN